MNTRDHISEQMHSMLKRHWGYDEFRPGQEAIIRSVIEGRDTLALMPTGGGKSITYQLPTLMSEGLCLVITPLISLMKDQVDRLRKMGILATAIHSGLSRNQIDAALDNCVYGDIKLLYVAPERIETEDFRMRIERMKVSLIAVDEAHCISQWGYDFRPSYLRIAEIRAKLPDAPILALTASATELVADDIMQHLGFDQKNIIRTSFARPNISYAVRLSDDKERQLLRIINNVEGSGIVYLRNREGCEALAEMLRKAGHSASFYHAKLPHTERALRQEEWLAGKTRIMVATSAFGMGIDKSDVRFVVHYSLPDSLENYYQEAGRAGRDGRRSYAIQLAASDDTRRIQAFCDEEFPPLSDIKDIYDNICSMLQVAIGDGLHASFQFNIYEYCRLYRTYQGKVRAAIKLLQQNSYLTYIEEAENPARIIFNVGRDELYKIRSSNKDLEHIIVTLLRMYTGLFTKFTPIDEGDIATWTGYSTEYVKELLKRMWQMHIIRYIPSNSSPMIFFNEARLPKKSIFISPETYIQRKKYRIEHTEKMIDYISNTDICRSVVLQSYFGDKEAVPCGVCDVCLAKRRADTIPQNVIDQIITLLQQGDLSPLEIVDAVRSEPMIIGRAIEKLKEEHKISLTKENKLTIIE